MEEVAAGELEVGEIDKFGGENMARGASQQYLLKRVISKAIMGHPDGYYHAVEVGR